MARPSPSAPAAPDPIATGRRLYALLALLFGVNALSQIDRILPFILAESIKRDLGLSDTQIGLLTGLAFAVCYALLSMPLARLADRGSPRLVLIVCILLWSGMTGLGGLATGFVMLALTRFGVAFGEAGALPAGHALIARQVPPNRRGLAIGVFSMGVPLGTMIGFVLGGMVDQALGWRVALIGAGALGLVVALAALLIIRPTPQRPQAATSPEPFLRAGLKLAAHPAFSRLLLGALALGFAAAPFYAFTASFLIRTHDFSVAQAGLVFGLLQGAAGVLGALLGGRGFDRAVQRGRRGWLRPPAVVFLVSALTTPLALFSASAGLSVLMLTPAMLSFAFIMPWGFGAAQRIAGPGREALAASLLVMATGLVGPALGPLLVGVISDLAANLGQTNSLGLGLLVVPVASVFAGLALIAADRRIEAAQDLEPQATMPRAL